MGGEERVSPTDCHNFRNLQLSEEREGDGKMGRVLQWPAPEGHRLLS